MQKKAVILFSGGLDSTTCLAIAKSQGFAIYALSFFYHQNHSSEMAAAKKIAACYGALEHKVLSLDLQGWRSSLVVGSGIAVPDFQDSGEIPSTYVPARNTIFLSIALGWAESVNATDIFIAINEIDYSGYPDCRPDYLEAFEKMANLATKQGREGKHLTVHAPLLRMNKQQVVQQGLALGVDYSMTVSCYRADEQGHACGTCDSCHYRKKGFEGAGVPDPTRYQTALPVIA